jgi:hypothetical protein
VRIKRFNLKKRVSVEMDLYKSKKVISNTKPCLSQNLYYIRLVQVALQIYLRCTSNLLFIWFSNRNITSLLQMYIRCRWLWWRSLTGKIMARVHTVFHWCQTLCSKWMWGIITAEDSVIAVSGHLFN